MFLFCLLIAVAVSQPPIPTLPQVFQTDWTLSFAGINSDRPLLGGRFAVDYTGLGGFIHVEDMSSSLVPFVLQTSIIGTPIPSEGLLQGYQYLSNGRCWTIDKLTEADFHFFAIAIPPSATFLRNETMGGEVVGVWTYSAEIFDTATIWVRYRDSAPLQFNFVNSFLIPFAFTITNTRFTASAGPANWRPPAGNCPTHSFGSTSLITFAKKALYSYFSGRELFNDFFGAGTKLKRSIQQPPPPSPNPPSLHQYFSSQYVLGWGNLNEQTNWVQPNNIFKGQVVVDKIAGGLYYDIHDNQDANVPWFFGTSFITNPGTNGNVTAYSFLNNGRCWNLGFSNNPEIPIQIPADATFIGLKKVNGIAVEIWQFPYNSEYFDGTVQIAVNMKDSSILFINLEAEAYSYQGSSYFYFTNFNTTKPDPSNYAIPPGPCPALFA